MNSLGRPKLKQGNTNATFLLDTVVSVCKDAAMPTPPDTVIGLMQARLKHEKESIRSVQEEMHHLAPAYHKYVDLQERFVKHLSRADRLIGMLGREILEKAAAQIPEEKKNPIRWATPPEQLREELALWEAIEEYLFATREARVGEILAFLSGLLKLPKLSRQAIESALKQHPETFRVKKQGRDKLISLKATV